MLSFFRHFETFVFEFIDGVTVTGFPLPFIPIQLPAVMANSIEKRAVVKF